MEVVSPFAARAVSMATVWNQISVSVTLALWARAVTLLVNGGFQLLDLIITMLKSHMTC